MGEPHRVVIIGGGFGGLHAAVALKDPLVESATRRGARSRYESAGSDRATGFLARKCSSARR
jgi:cation diffusion facilitator CzcD-associated flavoprotein CzcO